MMLKLFYLVLIVANQEKVAGSKLVNSTIDSTNISETTLIQGQTIVNVKGTKEKCGVNSSFVNVTFEDEGYYSGCWKDGKQTGDGTMTWGNSDMYIGQWKAGQRSGNGRMLWSNGDSYTGHWKIGQRSGSGSMIWSNGDSYTGHWKIGQRSGSGSMIWSNGDSYTGHWKIGQRSGSGIMIWGNNDTYRGEWREGKRSGNGNMSWISGATYTGMWKMDLMNGDGRYEKTNVKRCTGNWQDGSLYGQGKCTFLQDRNMNDRFEGSFKNSYMNGIGTYTYSDNRVYKGNMSLDVMSGRGILKWREGYSYKGIWQNGLITGEGSLILPDNTEVVGKFMDDNQIFNGSRCCNNNFNVSCILLYNDMTLYNGECKDMNPDGYGRIIYGQGRTNALDQIYDGNFSAGKRSGMGLQYYNDQTVYFGEFINDEPSGTGSLFIKKEPSCYDVTTENGIETKRIKISSDITECQFKIEGRRMLKKKLDLEICQPPEYMEDEEEIDDDQNETDKEIVKTIEYNVSHCEQLRGKYCNQVKWYEGELINEKMRHGLGIQEFINGTLYYGNFANDQMHGSGVMVLPNNTFSSGSMYMDSFEYGLRLYPNKTLIGIRRNRALEILTIHQINIETGKTSCNTYYQNVTSTNCSTNARTIMRSFHQYKGDPDNGFATEDLQSTFYRGEIKFGKWHGLGYLWKKNNPTLIGMIGREKRLNGHGLRITYSEGNTMNLLLGYWREGRVYGPGISITKHYKLIGNFKSPLLLKNEKNSERIRRYISSNNTEFLNNIHMRKPDFND